MSTHANDTKHGITLTRQFDAPRDLVFTAWTDPKHLAQWWGPHGFTNPRCEADARTGGRLHIDMRSPDGTIFPCIGSFDEVLAPERIVFTTGAHVDDSGVPLFEVRTTVTFADAGGKTLLTVQAEVLKAGPGADQYLDGMEAGWTQSLERLETLVSSL